jgi:hypothetical protein
MKKLSFLFLLAILFTNCKSQEQNQHLNRNSDSIIYIEMHLSAFGVESDTYPSIDAEIDFLSQTSICNRWYYNPETKGDGDYVLSKEEMENLRKIAGSMDLEKAEKAYNTNKTDQPNSTLIIYTQKKRYEFYDYGLVGNAVLQKIYRIVYKFP